MAYDSNPNTGFPVYDSYNNGTVAPWGQWGGTSDAAPQWAALIAIADQGRAIAGLGSLDGRSQLLPALYQLPASDFHDISTGTSIGSPNYSATAGYDLVTGRGTPIANLVIAGLVGQSSSNPATHFSLSAPASTVTGSTFSLTVTALDASNSVSAVYQGTVQFASTDLGTGVVLPASYKFTSADNGVHTFTGLTLVTPGAQSVSAKDSVTGTIVGSVNLSVINNVPVLSGSSPLTYVKTQSPTAISPALSLTDPGHATLPSATVTITNVSKADDVLSFVNNDLAQYGNITGVYNGNTGTLVLSSSGSTATVAQFQSALRAVSYFNQSGRSALPGTRTVAFQVSNGVKMSNIVTSLITISNASTTTTVSSSTASPVFGQSVILSATIAVVSPGSGTPTAGTESAKVTFTEGSSTLAGTVAYSVVNGNLVAQLATSSLTAGFHAITASYSGDANFLGSTSAAFQQTVFHAGTTSAVTSSAVVATVGQPVTLSADVGVVRPGAGTPTAGVGSAKVTFLDGDTTLSGTVSYHVASGDLIATLTTSNLTAGIHAISAIYSRDSNFLDSTSALVQQTITRTPTASTISSSAASIVFGQPVTFTAKAGVINSGAGTPTAGTAVAKVTFMDGSNTLAGIVTYSVVNGTLIAQLTTSSLAAGSHSITTVYSGDSNNLGSRSTTLNQKIVPFNSTTTLGSSIATAVFGQPVALTATIGVANRNAGFSTAVTSTTNVTFRDGTNALVGTVAYSVANGNLIATLTTSKLSTGTHAITATYAGDSNNVGSSSTAFNQKIIPNSTATTISSSAAAVAFGQPISFTATIGVVNPGTGIPTAGTGTAKVTFMDGDTPIAGTVVYGVAKGYLTATLTTSSLTVGTHAISATYSGDANDLGSSSASLNRTIVPISTTSAVSSSIASAVFGQSVTFTAVISAVGSGVGIPTAGAAIATVTFLDGGSPLSGTVSYSVASGKLVATLTTASLTASFHTITATYSGNSNFLSNTSAPFLQTVFHAGTTAAISSSAGSIDFGQSVTFTVVIGVVSPGSGIPTAGTGNAKVTFLDGNTALSGIVSYSIVNGNLVATFTTSSLSKGTHSITAIYSGDSSFLARTSALVKLIVT